MFMVACCAGLARGGGIYIKEAEPPKSLSAADQPNGIVVATALVAVGPAFVEAHPPGDSRSVGSGRTRPKKRT